MLVLGQLTSPSGLAVPEGLRCQELKVRVSVTPLSPTATQAELLGQLTPKRFCDVPELSPLQLVPLLVVSTAPPLPTATHRVMPGQLTAVSVWSAPDMLLGRNVQVVP